MLVDCGTRSQEALTRLGLGLVPEWTADQTLEAQLSQHGVTLDDIQLIIQTHLHVDHAGRMDAFPMTTPVMVNRSELAFAYGGLGRIGYAPEDLAHVLSRLYTPGALGILDLENGERTELLPGISAVGIGGHTPGSIGVLVETDDGTACLCGDVIYEIQGALVERSGEINAFEPQTSGNFVTSVLEERRAIKRTLGLARFIYPSHDYMGAVVEAGKVVGRVGRSLPGPVLPLDAWQRSE